MAGKTDWLSLSVDRQRIVLLHKGHRLFSCPSLNIYIACTLSLKVRASTVNQITDRRLHYQLSGLIGAAALMQSYERACVRISPPD